LDNQILNQIKNHCLQSLNQESCGLVIDSKHGAKVFPCKNESLFPEFHFKINLNVFIENKVLYVYHSHVNCSVRPSILDRKYSEELCVPFLIYSIRDDEFGIYDNIGV
jgi:proteasome lid subunit RPN8/RPN11